MKRVGFLACLVELCAAGCTLWVFGVGMGGGGDRGIAGDHIAKVGYVIGNLPLSPMGVVVDRRGWRD